MIINELAPEKNSGKNSMLDTYVHILGGFSAFYLDTRYLYVYGYVSVEKKLERQRPDHNKKEIPCK